ncbi:hypothetical protein SAMN05720354_103159 [Nitrosospira sp. Nsp1]|nr:hypothetical protein SAMN05720354_103159 [Nitrosospira sp. Nsp1]
MSLADYGYLNLGRLYSKEINRESYVCMTLRISMRISMIIAIHRT